MFRNFPKELWVAVRITLVIAVAGGLDLPAGDARRLPAGLQQPGQREPDHELERHGGRILADRAVLLRGQGGLRGASSTPPPSSRGTPSTPWTRATSRDVPPTPGRSRASHGRHRAAGPAQTRPATPSSSEGSNLAPSNSLLISQVDTYAGYLHCVGIDTSGSFTAAQLQAAATDPSHDCLSTGATTTPIPIDLATGDFTSFDPDISVAAALAQVDMVAAARGLDPAKVHAVVEANITGRVLWIFGEFGRRRAPAQPGHEQGLRRAARAGLSGPGCTAPRPRCGRCAATAAGGPRARVPPTWRGYTGLQRRPPRA